MKRSTRRLSEVARHVIIPTGIVSTGWPAVEARIKEFGDSFDEWQRGTSKLILAKRENGDYAATVGGITLSIPRQVAKTYMISRIIFALCTLFPNLTVLWTAHRTRTATKTFASLRGFAGRKTVAPFVANVRAVNGEQEIHFTNGSVIMFGAREGGFGRGFDEVDIEVFDEAQILTEKALEDMVAATNQSRFPAGALLFFMGTPPRPTDPSEAFKLRRREALAGETEDAVYIECSADEDAEPDDREQWAIANPSYPHRTPLRSMLRLRKNLPSDESWKREALGIWDSDQQGSRLITAEQWEQTGRATPPKTGVKSFGVAFSFDGSRVAVAGAAKQTRKVHVELVDAQSGHMASGIASLADWLADRWRQTALIAISGRAGTEALRTALVDRGVSKTAIHVVSTPEYFGANTMFYDAVKDRTVTHLASDGQAVLDQSVAVSDKKMRGTAGNWGWDATVPGGDETPVEAVSVAYWAARTTKRVPGRKQELI
ncbi:hypothetical protein DEI99_005245 [Curtobacterium sp. MCLR17_036]|uniref:terminase n=1 Tax=Curtobacterium sp. MCLR17_036 TaxID=2175620 RepID=UPI0011B5E888|nr:terminase [Curtobacterium sp. MCLR17_036]WIE65945.1 hypothetical protein DEI99_005245 [Curtobacterium sp. MCLR17_036]